MNTLVIFDLDGVITSEEAYWDAAGLTLHELLYSPRYWNLNGSQNYVPAQTALLSRQISRATLPLAQILAFKARAVNSNWDTCYCAVCLHLISLLANLLQEDDILRDKLQPLHPWDMQWIARFREALAQHRPAESSQIDVESILHDPTLAGVVGLDLINRFDAYASKVLGFPIDNAFSRYSPFWEFCRQIFQEWYLGDELYTKTYGHAPAQTGKPGCIYFERPLLPIEDIRVTLQTLREQGYTPGFATGRVYQEAAYPLKMYNLLACFDEQHISTYDAVERAEARLRTKGDATLLSKPHPFPFLFALRRDEKYALVSKTIAPPFIVVGDSTSDILGGKAAGALTIAVLTGVRTSEARTLLEQSKPDFMIEDMTKLPDLLKETDSLETIQRMQFTRKEAAERLLRLWFQRHMQLEIDRVTLTPKPTSLNSFNGVYQSNGAEYFFKTHVEEQGILEEYYHAELLQQAGYNIVRPLRLLQQKEQQMVVYPVVKWPVMFDLMRKAEKGEGVAGDMLVEAEQHACARLLDIYQSTFAQRIAEEHAQAPIHQLFWHRLTGGRLDSFYRGKSLVLPSHKSSISFEELCHLNWVINGVKQQHTLGELIEQAISILRPDVSALTIIGHGDAHFGNVFLEHERDYLYFDPAFAGRHIPLLDIIKPLYHNVFATWMYFPREVAHDLQLSIKKDGSRLFIEHDYQLTPVRRGILESKIHHLLTPLIEILRKREALPDNWERYVQLALMCCPLLTVNLMDGERFPTVISWLGLAHAVQMGNSGISAWRDER
ncbi:MAG TPA: HAD hydrolase-like protein [Ktedonobacteraceae bacterium]|nr:HAD hydrolase-like protein [Ktedonobacteraceae bacterium]